MTGEEFKSKADIAMKEVRDDLLSLLPPAPDGADVVVMAYILDDGFRVATESRAAHIARVGSQSDGARHVRTIVWPRVPVVVVRADPSGIRVRVGAVRFAPGGMKGGEA